MQAKERRERLLDGFHILYDGKVAHLSELFLRYDIFGVTLNADA
jgi:hypothetical protein